MCTVIHCIRLALIDMAGTIRLGADPGDAVVQVTKASEEVCSMLLLEDTFVKLVTGC